MPSYLPCFIIARTHIYTTRVDIIIKNLKQDKTKGTQKQIFGYNPPKFLKIINYYYLNLLEFSCHGF